MTALVSSGVILVVGALIGAGMFIYQRGWEAGHRRCAELIDQYRDRDL